MMRKTARNMGKLCFSGRESINSAANLLTSDFFCGELLYKLSSPTRHLTLDTDITVTELSGFLTYAQTLTAFYLYARAISFPTANKANWTHDLSDTWERDCYGNLRRLTPKSTNRMALFATWTKSWVGRAWKEGFVRATFAFRFVLLPFRPSSFSLAGLSCEVGAEQEGFPRMDISTAEGSKSPNKEGYQCCSATTKRLFRSSQSQGHSASKPHVGKSRKQKLTRQSNWGWEANLKPYEDSLRLVLCLMVCR